MPQSRNRPGHPHQKEAAIPAKQRVKGRVIWAVLFCVFGFLVAYFAVGKNLVVLIAVTIAAGIVGYIAGKKMEIDAGHK